LLKEGQSDSRSGFKKKRASERKPASNLVRAITARGGAKVNRSERGARKLEASRVASGGGTSINRKVNELKTAGVREIDAT